MREKRRAVRAIRLNIGSASIIMLFAVLCLTVLAALSLLSANSQWALASRSAGAVTEYYEADLKATEIFGRVLDGDMAGVEVTETPEGVFYSYQVPINERQALTVTLRKSAAGLEVQIWKAVDSGDWTPDEGVRIWDGELLEG